MEKLPSEPAEESKYQFKTMKIFFLGTGSAEGLPALFCRCAVCTQAQQIGGKNKRTRSTVLVNDFLKIDLPPDTLAHVHTYGERLSLPDLEHLLFTHSHDDHFAVRELQYLSPNFAPLREKPLHVWGTAGLLQIMQKEMAHFFEAAPLRFCALTPFEEVTIGNLHITPIAAQHKDGEVCLNFLINEPETGKTVLYASDTGWYHEPTWEFLSRTKINAAIFECGKGISDNLYAGHLNLNEAAGMKARLEATGTLPLGAPVYLTHICHTGLLGHEEMETACAPLGMHVAWDGMELII